jgi:hypothetical protein
VARLLFSKAERQALVELARQMDLGLGRMVQGMIKFMSNPAHWEQESKASRGMVMSVAMERGAAGEAAREEHFMGEFKGKLRLSVAVCGDLKCERVLSRTCNACRICNANAHVVVTCTCTDGDRGIISVQSEWCAVVHSIAPRTNLPPRTHTHPSHFLSQCCKRRWLQR